jgi:hypothetical protein
MQYAMTSNENTDLGWLINSRTLEQGTDEQGMLKALGGIRQTSIVNRQLSWGKR